VFMGTSKKIPPLALIVVALVVALDFFATPLADARTTTTTIRALKYQQALLFPGTRALPPHPLELALEINQVLLPEDIGRVERHQLPGNRERLLVIFDGSMGFA
jgi:hypothetical protein